MTDAPDLRHHGDREVGPGLVDLAVNVRIPRPPRWLLDRIAATLPELAAYPDATDATTAVARLHERPLDEVLLTSGAAEAFVLLARALRPRRAVVVHPQFTEPEAALLAAGHKVERLLLAAEDGFRLDPALVPEDADLVVVGNPTNPTGVLHPAAALSALARPGRTLVVDEAFMDAVPGRPETLAAARLPGLVVLRSLTKTWGLAGLRIGYAVGDAAALARLREAQPLWSVSSPALAAAIACSEPCAQVEAEKLAVAAEADRLYLERRLLESPGATLPAREHARAPFVLLHIEGADKLRLRLRERGFAVRRADTFPGLGPDWLRIAVRDRSVTDALVAALRELGG
ncbi:Rv2231c family pyridoxal phosphate-dependent protein CobC [Actinospica sp.]|uniref:Rv2231c family pyridoxal phosphate-dependent protein CobC n=1 Tax=Actinospica sp. TaxID=1872142 RepID=UPI002BE5C3B5|nr:Rv2231c family pyridoxal phosphate-dependent protein CobC [Actinospica sp.]HWG26934.1 Rv2231c family pyridoxal phosphate-dependent protein CobC [Actinospica sp.]